MYHDVRYTVLSVSFGPLPKSIKQAWQTIGFEFRTCNEYDTVVRDARCPFVSFSFNYRFDQCFTKHRWANCSVRHLPSTTVFSPSVSTFTRLLRTKIFAIPCTKNTHTHIVRDAKNERWILLLSDTCLLEDHLSALVSDRLLQERCSLGRYAQRS